jgi:hypothetical protein
VAEYRVEIMTPHIHFAGLKQQTARAVISTAQFHPGPDAGNTSFGE